MSHPKTSSAQISNNCETQPISFLASGSEPENPPSNAIDNNLNTRWSNPGLDPLPGGGVGAWAQLHQGSGKVVCSVDIAWYRGNLRQNNFVIYVWDQNNLRWLGVFSGKSSGTTAGPERYDFPDIDAAYILVEVRGNTENNYASISEIDVNGYSSSVNNSCETQPISFLASGSEPENPPSNAIDNNLNTRWSNPGLDPLQVAVLVLGLNSIKVQER